MVNINTHKAWNNFQKVLGYNSQLFWQYVACTDHCPDNCINGLTKEHCERIERLLQPDYYVILKIWHAQWKP